MSFDEKLFDFIKRMEGLELTVYKDSIGLPTVGIGHLIKPSDNLKVGDRITQEEAMRLFKEDAATAVSAVERLVKVLLTENQKIALVSFVFNLGANALAKSTLLKYLNSGQIPEAADQFAKWVYAGGRKLQGLINRRNAEKQLFLTGDTE